jgi:hypothetical protein
VGAEGDTKRAEARSGSSNTWHRAHFDGLVREYGFAQVSDARMRDELGYVSAAACCFIMEKIAQLSTD